MMNVVSLEDYKAKAVKHCPRTLTLHSHTFRDEDGDWHTVHVHILVEDGDALGVMARIIQDGGIGRTEDDGTYTFIPWPCAAVEIRDVPDAPVETERATLPETL